MSQPTDNTTTETETTEVVSSSPDARPVVQVLTASEQKERDQMNAYQDRMNKERQDKANRGEPTTD